MITIFNRKELTITYELAQQNQIRKILADHGIDYQIKVTDLTSPSPIAPGSRSRSGTLGMDTAHTWEYKIYVKKADYELAQHLLRQF